MAHASKFALRTESPPAPVVPRRVAGARPNPGWGPGRFLRGMALTAGALASLSCANDLDPGEHPNFRLTGVVFGDFPLGLFPPVADRSGNVYTLWWTNTRRDPIAFLSRPQGRSNAVCEHTKGDNPVAHGWVGYSLDHAWYWAGDALVDVAGEFGSCEAVLDHDPGTDTNLHFMGFLPWVRDSPLAPNTIVSIVKSDVDPAPFIGLIDLDSKVFLSVRPFSPPEATFVRVLGTAGSRGDRVGAALYTYRLGDTDKLEARYYDQLSNETDVVPIESSVPTESLGLLPNFPLAGFMTLDSAGVAAGLIPGTGSGTRAAGDAGAAASGNSGVTLNDPTLVVFNRKSGMLKKLDAPFDPVGIHLWHGTHWLVGLSGNEPVIARLNGDGTIGQPETWLWNQRASANVSGAQTVLDDRSVPARRTQWDSARPWTGNFLFMSPYSPFPYSDADTLALIGGPQFNSGSDRRTMFAFAPIGITYP